MSDLLKSLIKESGNEFAGIASDGIEGSDVTGFINTGSHVFNACCQVHCGGIPNNKIMALAGESATGKTYFALVCARSSSMTIQKVWFCILTPNKRLLRI